MGNASYSDTIHALGIEISVSSTEALGDYISLTDIARYKSDEPSAVIANWMRNWDTISFLGIWEMMHNCRFNSLEFEGIKSRAGRNAFAISPKKWVESTNAIGIKAKGGRYGGAYAHIDIAFEFASWISPEFKLYVIEDYRRLKTDESNRLSFEWNEKRLFAKINYELHADAVRRSLIPDDISGKAASFIYATEADVLNVALFGKTAKQWRDENADKGGNIRDYATLHQLIVLANLESMNAELLKLGKDRPERAAMLNRMAREQLATLIDNAALNRFLPKDSNG